MQYHMTRVGAHIHVHQAVAWFEATNVVRRLVHTRLVNPREQAYSRASAPSR